MTRRISVGDNAAAREVRQLVDALAKTGMDIKFVDHADLTDEQEKMGVEVLFGSTTFPAGPALVHPSASVGEDVEVGAGTVVLAGTRITTNVRIGEGCFVGYNVVISHDCRVGNRVHLGDGALLNGNVVVRDDARIGTGAILIPSIEIGRESEVLAGSVVLASVGEATIVFGNPATVG
jgi:acetyltransferase-like isoleucine patch superfamily enzyme